MIFPRKIKFLPCLSLGVISVWLSLVTLASVAPAAAELVRTTGRAALEAGNESIVRRRALEDALYLAALEGGADVDGFSVVEKGVLTGESILLRPSSRILDFAILKEGTIGSHYEVTVEAYVGDRPATTCAVRPDILLTAVRPQLYASQTVPVWMSNALARAHDYALPMLHSLDKIRIDQRDISIQAALPAASSVQEGFDYQTLLTGRSTSAPQARLPEHTRALHLEWRADAQSSRSNTVDITLNARIVDTANPSQNKQLRVFYRAKLAPATPWRTVNVLGSKDYDALAKDIAQALAPELAAWLAPMACAPLTARLEARGNDRFHVPLGARDGLTRQSLAFVQSGPYEWSVLRIVELGEASAVLAPMNSARAVGNFVGAQVNFSSGRK
jgi:hypothetical protein